MVLHLLGNCWAVRRVIVEMTGVVPRLTSIVGRSMTTPSDVGQPPALLNFGRLLDCWESSLRSHPTTRTVRKHEEVLCPELLTGVQRYLWRSVLTSLCQSQVGVVHTSMERRMLLKTRPYGLIAVRIPRTKSVPGSGRSRRDQAASQL